MEMYSKIMLLSFYVLDELKHQSWGKLLFYCMDYTNHFDENHD